MQLLVGRIVRCGTSRAHCVGHISIDFRFALRSLASPSAGSAPLASRATFRGAWLRASTLDMPSNPTDR
jgi:hypothetical protein